MPYDALRTILPIAGWPSETAVEFIGGSDPILPTPFRIGVAGAATLAATGLAAAALWELRTGRRQTVAVDVRQATASLRSGHYMKLGDGQVAAGRNSIMGVYPAKDGRWSYLHCNFPNHRAAALSVLGCAEDLGAVTRAVATWNAAELEEAIIAAKGAGGMVRTKQEWARHPQGIAVAGLPLMEVVRIGDSPPEPLPRGDRPLSGSACARPDAGAGGADLRPHAAEHGADVREGHRRGPAQPWVSGIRYRPWQAVDVSDRGRRAMSRRCGGWSVRRTCFRRAIVRARSGRSGLSPEELATIRPGLVYVSHCRRSVMPDPGRSGVDLTPWCSRSAASPRGRPRWCRARPLGRSFIRSPRSITAPAILWHSERCPSARPFLRPEIRNIETNTVPIGAHPITVRASIRVMVGGEKTPCFTESHLDSRAPEMLVLKLRSPHYTPLFLSSHVSNIAF